MGYFLGHKGPKRRDIPDKNFMQVAFFCCFRQGVAGMSRDLGRDVPHLEKLYARKLWADFSYPKRMTENRPNTDSKLTLSKISTSRLPLRRGESLWPKETCRPPLPKTQLSPLKELWLIPTLLERPHVNLTIRAGGI